MRAVPASIRGGLFCGAPHHLSQDRVPASFVISNYAFLAFCDKSPAAAPGICRRIAFYPHLLSQIIVFRRSATSWRHLAPVICRRIAFQLHLLYQIAIIRRSATSPAAAKRRTASAWQRAQPQRKRADPEGSAPAVLVQFSPPSTAFSMIFSARSMSFLVPARWSGMSSRSPSCS